MKIDLSTLRENDLRKYSYETTKSVIDELENVCISNFVGIHAIEQIETYYAFARLIKNRVSNNEFIELNVKARKSEKEHLYTRLNFLLAIFKYSLEIGKLENRTITTADDLSTKLSALKEQFNETVVDYNSKKNELETKINAATKDLGDNVKKFKERIDDSEHTILTHVLTLMGVFSAVITIIMSVVITSSSWLNNASGAAAIAAFIIPNLVALLAVIVLLSLIFIYHSAVNVSTIGTPKSKKAILFFCGLFGVIILLSCLISWVAVSYKEKNEVAHMQYVLSPAEYRIEKNLENNSNNDISYYEFTIEGINYKFPYDPEFIHNEYLYFCLQHMTLE